MSIFRSLITNTASRSVAELLNRFGSAIFWMLIARMLGLSALGSISFALYLFALFETISVLGLPAVVIRDLSRSRENAATYFGNLLLMGLSSSICLGMVMVAIAYWLKPNADTLFAVKMMALALIPATAFTWSRAMLTAAEKMSYIAVSRAAENIFKVVVGVTLLCNGGGIRSLLVVVALSKVVSFVVCYVYAIRKVVAPSWKFDRKLFKSFLHQAPAFFSIAVFNSLFWSLSVIMITKMRGETDAGLFSAAFKIVDLCLAFTAAFGYALYPVISRISRKDHSLFQSLCIRSIKYVLILTLAISAGVTVLSSQIVMLLYGADSMAAAPVLSAMIWLIMPFSVAYILAYSLLSYEKQKLDLISNIVATFTLFFGNLLLLPGYGVWGATFAILLGCFIFVALQYFWVARELFKIRITGRILRPVLSVVSMVVVVFWLRDKNVFLSVAAGSVVFLINLWLTKTITLYDLAFLKRLSSI